MQPLNINVVQARLAWEKPESNRHRLERLILDNTNAADVLLLPEMFTTGFTMNAAAFAEPMDGETVDWMGSLAGQIGGLVCGSLIIAADGRYYNRMVCAGPEGVVATYDKRHLFRMAKEEQTYAGGTELVTFAWKGWRISPFVCYDLRFPVWSRNSDRYDLALYVANWPERRASQWTRLLAARAIENQCYIAGSNRVGEDDKGLRYRGDSVIVDYYGDFLQHMVRGEGVLKADLYHERLQDFRKQFPAWMDADDYTLQV